VTPKKNYSRYFIILQEDEKGYSLDSDKIPSGYAKLEMKNSKCKISYYVQNLRKEKQPYYMILICGKKDVNKIIKVGKLNIDDHGRVDIFQEYDMDNIADTGISAEKIVGAAIVKFLDTNVVSIMSGFSTTDKPIEWKGYKLADSNNEKKESKAEDVPNEFDEYEQNIEIIKVKSDEVAKPLETKNNVDNVDKVADNGANNVADKVIDKVADKVIDKKADTKKRVNIEAQANVDALQRVNVENAQVVKDQKNVDEVIETKESAEKRIKAQHVASLEEQDNSYIEQVDEADINQRSNICDVEISDQLEEEVEFNNTEDIYDENRDKNKKLCKEDKKYKDNKGKDYCKEEYPKGAVGNFFKAVAKDFNEVPNFTKEIKWCTWYKVPVHNLEKMYDLSDYNKYTIAYYPMICYYPYIRNYKSFMLGYKCDSSGKMKYIVYGIPGARTKGHQPYGGKTGFVTWIPDKDNDEMGYWLMFYDFKNSTIVVPIKK